MSLGDYINKNKNTSLILALILLAGAAGYTTVSIYSTRNQSTRPDRKWFLDIQTNRLFAGPAEVVAPTEAPSGGTAVEARLFTCGQQVAGKVLEGKTPQEIAEYDVFVGYLVRLTPEGQRKYAEIADKPEGKASAAMLMSSYGEVASMIPEGPPQWRQANPNQLLTIMQQMQKQCGGGKTKPKECFP